MDREFGIRSGYIETSCGIEIFSFPGAKMLLLRNRENRSVSIALSDLPKVLLALDRIAKLWSSGKQFLSRSKRFSTSCVISVRASDNFLCMSDDSTEELRVPRSSLAEVIEVLTDLKLSMSEVAP